MGILGVFKSRRLVIGPLPSGTYTVDSLGRIVSSTLPKGVSREILERIARAVLVLLGSADHSKVPIEELTLRYASLVLTAKKIRGGAMIFLTPRKLGN